MQEIREGKFSELKTSKGYRLKISTHAMIKGLQELTGSDADLVITKSCILFYKQLLESKEQNIENRKILSRKEDL